MQWFYALNGDRLGPVSPEQLSNLVADGTVTAETLVWRDGFASWEPWGQVAAANPLPAPSADFPPPPVAPGAGGEYGSPELVWSIDEFAQHLEEQGFATSVGGVLSRAWANYKSFFGLALGAVFVAYLVTMVAGFIPIIGMLSGILITPHINAGVAWVFLKRARGEVVEFGDVFAGFSRCYLKLALVGLIQFGAVLFLVLIFVIPMVAVGVPMSGEVNPGSPPDISTTAGIAMVVLMMVMAAVMIFLSVRFFVTSVVAIDRDDSAINAFKLSWRISRGRFWTILGLLLVLFLLGLAGTLALLIGLIFVAPMLGAVIAQIYHDACESAAGRPPE
ncbi:MAG: GYF domain-containing protein [bacterium]